MRTWDFSRAAGCRIEHSLLPETPAPTVAMKLLPYETGRVADAEPGYSRKNACRRDNAEEVPQAFDERPALQLRGEQSPCEGCRANKARQKSEVCSEILYRCAAKLIELGKNRCSRAEGAIRMYLRAVASVAPLSIPAAPRLLF